MADLDNTEVKENEKLENDVNTDEDILQNTDDKSVDDQGQCDISEKIAEYERKISSLEDKLEEKESQCDDYLDKLQRIAAEFDNYKKRTARERQSLYNEASRGVILSFLPVIDNIERALSQVEKEENNPLKDGVEMIYRQISEVLEKLDVKEIKSIGEKFNPEYHNAVLHIEDDAFGENEIVEELQKGYISGEKVIRHSTVKVAN